MATQNKHAKCTLYSISNGKSKKNQAHSTGKSKGNWCYSNSPTSEIQSSYYAPLKT